MKPCAANRFKPAIISAFQFFVVFCWLAAAPVYAGIFDGTFGASGKVRVEFPFPPTNDYSSSGYRVFIQPSGRIVGIGFHRATGSKGATWSGVAMVGLTQTGALDEGFSGGKVLNWDSGSNIGLNDAQMLPDGRLLYLSLYNSIIGVPILNFYRVNTDGSTDTSFAPNVRINTSRTYPGRFAVQADGKIIVLVFTGETSNRFYLIRLLPDGSRDPGFGSGGVKEIIRLNNLSKPSVSFVRALPNGKTLIGGSLGDSTNIQEHDELFLLRVDSDGNADHSFGGLGAARLRLGGLKMSAADLAVQPDGRYLILGSIKNPDSDVLMARFTSRGKTDGSFGNAGNVITDFTINGEDSGARLALLSNGKIIVVGRASLSAGAPWNFLLARHASNGLPEVQTQTAFTNEQNSGASDVIIQPDGKILVFGFTRNPNPEINGNIFAFARYMGITND
ncbi:MAG TPA: hypothetical protein VF721_15360 [Pyrinomonadaceae bacterium]|jgi:uncharacterized delta-60 repeat protein